MKWFDFSVTNNNLLKKLYKLFIFPFFMFSHSDIMKYRKGTIYAVGTDDGCGRIKREKTIASAMKILLYFVLLVPIIASAGAVNDTYSTTGISISGNVLDNDGGNNISVTNWNNPSHGTLSGTHSDGRFTYTPDSGFTGTDTFTYQMREWMGGWNGHWSYDTATVTITVTAPTPSCSTLRDSANLTSANPSYTNASHYNTDSWNVGPNATAMSRAYKFTVDSAGTVAIDLTRVDNNQAKFSVSQNGCPSTFDGLTSSQLTFSSAGEFYVYIYYVPGSNSNIEHQLDVVFTPPVTAVAVDDTFSTQIDTTLYDNVLTNDEGTGLTVTSTDITGLSGTMNSFNVSTGAFSYTPGSGFSGSESFTYTIKDSNGNTSTATVTISVSNVVIYNSGGRDFELRNPEPTRNIVGDISVIGNTVQCLTNRTSSFGNSNQFVCNNNAGINDVSNDYYTKYIDVDSDTATFNSSSATLNIPTGSTVVWAGLYWQGFLHKCTSSDSDECRFHSDTSVSSNNINLESNSHDAHQVLLKKPGAITYTTVTAEVVDYIYYSPAEGTVYDGYANVTNLLTANAANGSYTLANVQSMEGKWGYGNYGGWSLFVIYKDPNGTMHNNSVFDGFKRLQNNTEPIPINGFYTPSSGTISSRLLTFAGEGENNYVGDSITVGGTANTVSNANNPSNNVFNSTLSGFTHSPALTNNNGIDIDTFDTSSFMTYNQTDTTITIRSGIDAFYPSVLAFSVQLYQPEVCYQEEVFVVNDQGVESPLTSTGAYVDYESTLRSKVYITNNSDELAQYVSVSRKAGQEDTLPYVADSTKYNNNNPTFNVYPFVGTLVTATDINDSDNFTNVGRFNINIGADADGTIGGMLYPKTSTNTKTSYFEFNAELKSENNISFEYVVTFKNETLNITFEDAPLPKCSDFNNSFWGRRAVVPSSGSFGIADTWRNYESTTLYSREISTKVVNRPFGLRGFNLNQTTGEPEVYNGTYSYTPTKTVPMSAFLSVSNDTCTEDNDDFGFVEIAHNQTSALAKDINNIGSTNLYIPKASKQHRIKAQLLDWRNLLINASSLTCAQSSLTSTLCGVPACMNNAVNIYRVFPQATYPHVTVCVNGDSNTSAAPCDSNAYYGNCGGRKMTISPAKYNNDMGCAMCLADAGAVTTCSADDLAVRPKDFTFDPAAQVFQSNNFAVVLSEAGVHPVSSANKLRSGEEYNMTIYARDFVNNATLDYNQSTGYISAMTKHYLYAGGTLTQQDPVTTLNDVNITNLSAGGQFYDGNTTQFKIRYDEVGVVDLDLNDTNWAAVDTDDTGVSEPLPLGSASTEPGYVIYSTTAAPLRLTVKPYDFNITAANVFDNNNPSGFTYLSDDINMTARLPITIRAQNKDGNVTQNYSDMTQGLYEQLANFTFTLDPTSYPSVLTLVPYLPVNADLPFNSGIAIINETDDNVTRFNFDRNTSVPVNPFKIEGTDVNLSITDADNVRGDANGTFIGDATFVYGRVHMPRVRAMCSGSPCAGNMTFFFEFYGDKDANTTLITNLVGTPAPRSLDSVNWYRNTAHNTNVGDGNVTSSTTNIPGTVTYTINGGSTSSAIYNYSGTQGYPFKGTINVNDTNNTQTWLIYDKYNAAAHQVHGELEFYGPGEWSSTTGAESTIQDKNDTNRNKNTNRRIRW